MTELYHRFQLRLPFEVWKQLEALAKRERRSVTAQILIAIEDLLNEDMLEGGPKKTEK